jgi:hypothetical protein
MVFTFTGTDAYALPEYLMDPSKGFNVFDLEDYATAKTIEWMHQAATSFKSNEESSETVVGNNPKQ